MGEMMHLTVRVSVRERRGNLSRRGDKLGEQQEVSHAAPLNLSCYQLLPARPNVNNIDTTPWLSCNSRNPPLSASIRVIRGLSLLVAAVPRCAVSPVFNRRGVRVGWGVSVWAVAGGADCKSAIRQVANLRYGAHAGGCRRSLAVPRSRDEISLYRGRSYRDSLRPIMISPATAALAVSVARGLIKFGQRLDALMAEKQAIEGGLALVMPEVYRGPDGVEKCLQLRAFLDEVTHAADLLGSDHAELVLELKKEEPENQFIGECYARVFPERLAVAALDPDAKYVEELRKRFPAFDLTDVDCVAAAFHIPAGRDDRQIGYGARIGLLVADVMAEFGAQNSTLFVRDPGLRSIVVAVLERFARPDLENFTEWSPLLRHALSATLNGLLDARGALVTDSQWLVSLMDVLVAARDDPAGGEDFVAGLFQGEGFALLLSKGLGRAAEVLAEDQADPFKQMAADLLKAAAPLAKASPNFRSFFADHWGDLLRAGLSALERHGPVLLKGQPELLGNVLIAMVGELKQIPQANLLSHETLFRLGDAAIAAVAANPELLEARVGNEPWLRALLRSFVNTVARDGIRLSFSREGLEEIVTDAAGVFAAHPELIVDAENAGLVREVVGGILRAVSELPSLDARNIATAAASGTLRAIAANPSLVDTRYAKLISDFCGRLAECVQDRTLTGIDASAIASAAVETLLNNPGMFDEARSNLATATLDAVMRAAGNDPAKLLVGSTLVHTVREVLAALARHGKAKVQTAPFDKAVDRLAEVLEASLALVSNELGRRLDLTGVPALVGALVAAWAREDFVKIEPEAPLFNELLGRLLASANTR
jgi:hypothetical protein